MMKALLLIVGLGIVYLIGAYLVYNSYIKRGLCSYGANRMLGGSILSQAYNDCKCSKCEAYRKQEDKWED